MNINLPELPECREEFMFDAIQMVVYGKSCARAALEAAANVCQSVDNYANPMTANDCADTIRALMGEQK